MRLIPLLGLVGCVPVSDEVPLERTWDGPFLIDEVVIDCDGSRSWTYDVRTSGWGDAVTVDTIARQSGALVWNEHHRLPEIEHGEDWAHHRIVLDQVTDEGLVVEGESTWFACEGKTLLTYGIAAWRTDGAMEECVAWGIDPEGEFPDCTSWGTNGH